MLVLSFVIVAKDRNRVNLENHTVIIVQALRVVLEPNRTKHVAATKGKATPVILFAAHIVPNARPFLRTNHWSRYRDDGLNSNPFPIAHITPCVAIRCHTSSAKDDRRDPITVMTSPAGAQYTWSRGYRVNKVKVTGDRR